MKILFFGLGSIGQRHVQNLIDLFDDEFQIFAVRSVSHNLLIRDGHAIEINNIADLYGITEFINAEEAFNSESFDIVYVTNPSSLHFDTLLLALENKCNVFVEKPICISTEQVNILKNLPKEGNIVYVGYQTQFDPIYIRLKQIISQLEFGELISFRSEWCTFLPYHHKYENYINSYAANNDLGGGVLLGLSHELHTLIDLFGCPIDVHALELKNGELDINSDDTYLMLFKMNNASGGTLSLSYSQTLETRNLSIHFAKGTILCNFSANKLYYQVLNEDCIEEQFSHTRNDIFSSQTIEFIRSVRDNDENFDNREIAFKVVELVDHVKNTKSFNE